ncbi:pathogenicity island effector protein (plasmid) [Burkholderia sp. FERM BP-3421]|jgi:secreted effector protein SseD|uniref:pathogenicity island effector protein n=1 Tax=Burkholderia sp. FERM BP-3421 TaxID=1494466 RepID=UPI00235F35A9|nr:pathogenicity island effector protein [Burkholderia sp. FERM BP-3421]WDD90560.1 pathogenicity island effector protein [Burkholderia sp. FERM BP-3421]
MSEITPTGRAPVSMDTLGIDSLDGFGAGSGALATINQIIARLQKIGGEMRDLERQFSETMQRIAFDRQVLALDTKRQAIEQNFDAAMATAVTQIVGGAVSALGALSGSQIATSTTDGLSKSGQGIAGVASANMTREAQQIQLQGDFESQAAERFDKTLATAVERATDASRQMRDVTRDLVSLSGQVASAVRL